MIASVSAWPETSGVASAVVEPSTGVSTTGAAGAVVSTVNVRVVDAPLVLPTASVAVAEVVWAPSDSGTVGA